MQIRRLQHRLVGGCILAALFCTTAAGATAAETLHWHNDLRVAAEESQRLQKPMLIEITAVWCGYCKKMKRTYANDQVVRHVNGCFVPVEIDADEHKRLVAAVGADTLPTTVIISPEFKLLKKITGYHTPDELNDQLGEICQAGHDVVDAESGDQRSQPSAKPASRITRPAENPNFPAVKPPTPTPQKPTVKPVKTSRAKPAFDRHCLVSLLEDRKLRPCGLEHTAVYKGRLLCFADEDRKRRFEAGPEKYWPALDGRCPVSAIDAELPVEGRAVWGAIYHGRLWFFSDKESRRKFAASPAHYASAAPR